MASLAKLTVRTPDAAVRLYFDAMRRAAAHTIWLEDLDRGTHGWRYGHTGCSRSFSSLLAQHRQGSRFEETIHASSSALLRRFLDHLIGSSPPVHLPLRDLSLADVEDWPRTWALGEVKWCGLRARRIRFWDGECILLWTDSRAYHPVVIKPILAMRGLPVACSTEIPVGFSDSHNVFPTPTPIYSCARPQSLDFYVPFTFAFPDRVLDISSFTHSHVVNTRIRRSKECDAPGLRHDFVMSSITAGVPQVHDLGKSGPVPSEVKTVKTICTPAEQMVV
ncbi:hypothetical protein B0H11DRAFT_2222762 [Mycena galericulata]|nr:hypothetical protein B0H11DRAFT_2222762 [Mycena galericulata]